jgi:phage shock protein C
VNASRPATRKRLLRDREKGRLFGVCAGLADYFGLDLGLTRIVTFVALLLFTPAMLLIYFALVLLLSVKPRSEEIVDATERAFVKSVRSEPQAVLSQSRHRFRELELRLQRLEKYVTSSSYNLDKEFESLNR